MQFAEPSLTVTVPVGVPAPGAHCRHADANVIALSVTVAAVSPDVMLVAVGEGLTLKDPVAMLGLKLPV